MDILKVVTRRTAIRVEMITLAAMAVFALVGIILGAFNYAAGPIQYPGWLLAIWMVVDVLTCLIVFAHLALFVLLGASWEDEGSPALVIGAIVAALIWGVLSLFLIPSKHFAGFSFGALIATVIVGTVAWLTLTHLPLVFRDMEPELIQVTQVEKDA